MEYLFLIAVLLSLTTTFLCALTEAALYAVPFAFVKHLADEGSPAGKTLLRFKEDMATPIAAILVINTAGATLGASIAGAAAGQIFTEMGLLVFGVVFTLITLYLAEITPKIAGVIYSKEVARLVARPLAVLVIVLGPLIWLSRKIQGVLERTEDHPSVSHQEVLSLTAIGNEEGAIDDFEGSVIHNVIGLDRVLVRDVMTPRVVVFRLSQESTLDDVAITISDWHYTRIPVHDAEDPDHLTGYVMQRDLYRELLKGSRRRMLEEFSRKLPVIPEIMPADQLLLQMFEQREHICSVVDEHGAFVGIITLEDIIEEIVGREIVDEFDSVSDMRTFASRLKLSKTRKNRGDQ